MNIPKIGGPNFSGIYEKKQFETKKVEANKAIQKDNINLSESGKIFNAALQAAKDMPIINEAKVQRVAAQLKNGTYQVKPSQVADKMIEGSLFDKRV